MPNRYDQHLIREIYIPTDIIRVSYEGQNKKVDIDKGTMDVITVVNPLSAALMVYFAFHITINNTLKYTVHEILGATGKNRATVKGALRTLMDADYIIPVRHLPPPYR